MGTSSLFFILIYLFNIYSKETDNVNKYFPGNHPSHFSYLLYNKSENIFYLHYKYIIILYLI